jgi:hypothetical protein
MMIELDTMTDADHPTRTKLITQFIEKREAILSQDGTVPETQQRLADIDKMLQILADQIEPS